MQRHQHQHAVDLRKPVRSLLGHEHEVASRDLARGTTLDGRTAGIVRVGAALVLEGAARGPLEITSLAEESRPPAHAAVGQA